MRKAGHRNEAGQTTLDAELEKTSEEAPMLTSVVYERSMNSYGGLACQSLPLVAAKRPGDKGYSRSQV